MVKNLPANAGDIRDTVSIPRPGRFCWRRKWQFLPGESHGQRRLGGLQPIGSQMSDMTEAT